MKKQFLFYLLISALQELSSMEQNSAPLELVKFHLFNKSPGDVLNFEILKYYILKHNCDLEYSADVGHYKTEEITLFTNESHTFNVRPSSCGVVNIRFGETADNSDPVISVAYWWDEHYERGLLKSAIIKKFADTKPLRIDPSILAPSDNVAFVLKGNNMQDSFFYYRGMPEED